jgi:predicted dehydrogenase
MTTPVQVGLIGTGPWAQLFTAPLLAAGPHTSLAGVWGRNREAAAALAERFGVPVADSVEQLCDLSEAVACALPPDVQASLAMVAAQRGKPLLLDKPVGLTLDQARRFADDVGAAGVASQVVLTNRYLDAMRAFLADIDGFSMHGGRATFLSGGSIPGTYFATPWRLSEGGLLDLGPHVFDALIAAMGPIVDARAIGDRLGTIAVSCVHASGLVSQATMSGTTPVDPSGLMLEVWGADGGKTMSAVTADADDNARRFQAAQATIAAEFAETARSNTSHALDVHHAAGLQAVIQMAEDSLGH